MCNDFSGYVTQSHQVIWKRGLSSHDSLYSEFSKDFPELKEGTRRAVKFEITPDKGYLYPEKPWTFRVDESETPGWFTAAHKTAALRAHKQWKKEVYALINLEEARKPINPLTKKHKPTKKDIELLKQWDSVWISVWTSVGESAWASVGESVWTSVWISVWTSVGISVWTSVGESVRESVGAYQGSLFNIWGTKYKFQPAVDLWKRGFVASFDGNTWRLHSGKKAEIVFEIEKSKQKG